MKRKGEEGFLSPVKDIFYFRYGHVLVYSACAVTFTFTFDNLYIPVIYLCFGLSIYV